MAEGAPLLREYTLIGIEGSNPSLSAIINNKGCPKGQPLLFIRRKDLIISLSPLLWIIDKPLYLLSHNSFVALGA